MTVARGEVLALLGPSGSGKTTLLHAAAGFVVPTTGEIEIGGREVSRAGWALPPEKRSVGLVFQSYALWPHLNAVETVAYPLSRRGASREKALREAHAWLETVGLEALAQRKPHELSGGEQQRVGLARALASAPALFLFDEPTANLDASLKSMLQSEISQQQRSTGAGAIYVTHDPSEAFAVANRVAVLRQGRLVQVGDPVSIYSTPSDEWVAALTGPCSTLPASDAAETGQERITLRLGEQRVTCRGRVLMEGGGSGSAIFRPEWLTLNAPDVLPFAGRVVLVRFQGAHTDYAIDTSGGRIMARSPGAPHHQIGEAVSWCPERAVVTAAVG